MSSIADSLHAQSDELEALSNQLSVLDIAQLSSASRGWRRACLTWISAKAVIQVGETHGYINFRARNKVNAEIRYVIRHARGLRELELLDCNYIATEPIDLTALSLNCPPQLIRLKMLVDKPLPPMALRAVAAGCDALKHMTLQGSFREDEVLGFIEHSAALESFELRREAKHHDSPTSGFDSVRIMSAVARHYNGLQTLLFQDSMRDVRSAGLLFRGMTGSLPQLRQLDVSGFRDLVPYDLCAILEGCPCLEVLKVGGCKSLTDLQGLSPTLLTLEAGACSLTDDALQSIIQTCSRLEKLDIGWDKFIGRSSMLTTLHGGVSTLKTLIASGIRRLTNAALAAVLLNCSVLESLDISLCDGISSLTLGTQLITLRAKICKDLQTIEGNSGRLKSIDVSGCTRLESISCNCNSLEKLEASGLEVLSALTAHLPILREFNLSLCREVDLGQLSPDYPLLSRLDLRYSHISLNTLIVWTSACALLQHLVLADSRYIGDVAISHLASACPHLKHLDLRRCTHLSAVAFDIIRDSGNFPRLQELKICADEGLRAAVQALCDARPDLQQGVEFYDDLIRDNAEIGEQLFLKVVLQDGNELFFRLSNTTMMHEVMQACCNRLGIHIHSFRLLFDGDRIREDQTADQLGMEDGDALDMAVEQVNVGEWVAPRVISAGGSILTDGAAASSVSVNEALAIERTATGPSPCRLSPLASYAVVDDLLTPAQCAALISHAELEAAAHVEGSALSQHAAPPHDLKLDLTAAELETIVGGGVPLEKILRMGATQLDESDRGTAIGTAPRLVLRRSEATPPTEGQATCIDFHRDICRAVVSVALSDEHTGGQLVFAIDGQVHCPARPVGSAVAHNRTAVHGVTRITTGVRFNLVAVFGQVDFSSAA